MYESNELVYRPTIKSQYKVPIAHHKCGNIEVDVNFMSPKLIIYDSKNLLNLTITDTLNLDNPMHVKLNGQAPTDPLIIDSFYRQICTKRLLLDFCLMENLVEAIDTI